MIRADVYPSVAKFRLAQEERAFLLASRDPLLRSARVLLYLSMFAVPLTAIRSPLGFPWSDIFLFFSALLGVFSLAPRRPRVPRPLVVSSVLALIATGLLTLASTDPPSEVSVGLRLTFVWLVWTYTALRVLPDVVSIVRASTAFVMGCAFSSLVAAVQYLGVDLRPYLFAGAAPLDLTSRFVGLGIHPNGQGGVLAIGLVLCIAAVLYGVNRPVALALASVLLVGLMLCASITGVLAAVVGFLVVVVRAGRIRIAVAAAAISAAVCVGYWALKSAFPNLVTPIDRIDSATGLTGTSTVDSRFDTIGFAWNAISHNPFVGVGFAGAGGTFDGTTATHNMMVLAWYQGGLILFVAVCVVVTFALVAGWKRTGSALVEGAFAATVSAVFFAQTGPSLYDRYVWLPVVILVVARSVNSGQRRSAQQGKIVQADKDSTPPRLL